jgi:hypothetical protein
MAFWKLNPEVLFGIVLAEGLQEWERLAVSFFVLHLGI